MIWQMSHFLSRISLLHINVLFLLGLAVFGGTVGARLFQRVKIPQVVGYITIGIIVGQTGLNIVGKEIITAMEPFNYFALGLIGFLIGGELKKEVFRKYGKQFFVILLSEGLAAFFMVALTVGIVGSLFFGGTKYWALGIVLGAIASATAPAATTDVLWEYKSKGPLTSTVLGIVAMDDALALILFALMSTVASRILGQNQGSVLLTFVRPVYEIGGSVILGGLSGIMLSRILQKHSESDKILAIAIGVLLLILGMALTLKMDMLLSAMTLGAVLVNLRPYISKEIFKVVSGFTPPVYVLFFVLVGAKLNLEHMSFPLAVIAVLYLITRSLGKMAGADFGGYVSKAPETVRKYLKYCLFSQAGVAIGLSIVAYFLFPGEIGNSIVIIVTTTTFVVQLIGPVSTRYAVVKSGEAGLNVTEEDVIKKSSAEDVMDTSVIAMKENTSLAEVLDTFKSNDYMCYPVTSTDGKLAGIITMDSIRYIFHEAGAGALLLAHDLMEPAGMTVLPFSPLVEVKEMFDKYGLDHVPVVTKEGKAVGLIDRKAIVKFISNKMIEIEQRAGKLE